jgi:hypothetical protein
VSFASLLGKAAGRFANNLQGSYHRVLMELTLSEFLPGHAPKELACLTSSDQDVEQEGLIALHR